MSNMPITRDNLIRKIRNRIQETHPVEGFAMPHLYTICGDEYEGMFSKYLFTTRDSLIMNCGVEILATLTIQTIRRFEPAYDEFYNFVNVVTVYDHSGLRIYGVHEVENQWQHTDVREQYFGTHMTTRHEAALIVALKVLLKGE